MLSSLDDSIFKDGFYWGQYEVSVDTGPRVRLNKPIVDMLKKRKVRQLWEYPDPSGPRIILCPPHHQLTYIELAKQHLSQSPDFEKAVRKFIFAGTLVSIDNQGRILITRACRKHLKIEATDSMVIIGTGLWYELWREDDWAKEA